MQGTGLHGRRASRCESNAEALPGSLRCKAHRKTKRGAAPSLHRTLTASPWRYPGQKSVLSPVHGRPATSHAGIVQAGCSGGGGTGSRNRRIYGFTRGTNDLPSILVKPRSGTAAEYRPAPCLRRHFEGKSPFRLRRVGSGWTGCRGTRLLTARMVVMNFTLGVETKNLLYLLYQRYHLCTCLELIRGSSHWVLLAQG